MYDTGYGYPAIIPTKTGNVPGEKYMVSEGVYQELRAMEASAGYRPTVIGGMVVWDLPSLEMLLHWYPKAKKVDKWEDK